MGQVSSSKGWHLMSEPSQGNEISVVIQGPMRDQSGALLRRAVASIRGHLPGAEVIVSTWVGEHVDESLADKVVYTKDPGPDQGALGSSNQSRQALSTVAGLRVAGRPLALKWRVEFFLTSDQCALINPKNFDTRIRVLSSVTPDPLRDPRYFHLSEVIQFGRTSVLLRSWEFALELEPAFRSRGKRYSFWYSPFGNDPMARRPEQAFTIGLARTMGIEVDLDKSGAVKSNYKNFRNYLGLVGERVEVLDIIKSGVATKQDRFYRSDHSYPTSWQYEVPSRLKYLKSRFRWVLTKVGVRQAAFWIASLIHPLLAENLRDATRQIRLLTKGRA